jgi:hypothetical protein
LLKHSKMTTRKNKGVLRVSSENRRYFTDDTGQAVYLTGSHTWNTLSDQLVQGVFDFSAYLDVLERCNHNFFRLWVLDLFHTPEGDNQPIAFLRTGPGLARDGKPKFDLTRFDETYFDRMRSRVQMAGSRGMYVGVMLFEGWWITQWEEDGWSGHPFHPDNNIQAIPVTRLQMHTLNVPQVVELEENYVRKTVHTVNDLDNVLYEIANEDGGGSLEWQDHFVNYIRTVEKQTGSKRHPVGMTFRYPGGTNDELFDSAADWISPNAAAPVAYDYKTNPPPADGRKVILADTDHIHSQGLGADWVWKSFTRGLNPLLMEGWDLFQVNPPARKAMSETNLFASRVDLIHMDPCEAITSTRYCLAHRSGKEYLIYQPDSGPFQLDLTGYKNNFSIKWFKPILGEEVDQKEGLMGGSQVRLTPPWEGDAIAWLRR